MLVKALVLTALVASTPVALVVTQDPRPAQDRSDGAALRNDAASQRAKQDAQSADELAAVRRELACARAELQTMRGQLEHALDALDTVHQPRREGNCSPSRARSLMSHYQWLRTNGHAERASRTLGTLAEQLGDDPERLHRVAADLMTDERTIGQFDELALALAQRIEASGHELDARQLDTVALAHFLTGDVARATELQRLAVERGSHNDDYRRRLRTYEAAAVALTKARSSPVQPEAATMVAVAREE